MSFQTRPLSDNLGAGRSQLVILRDRTQYRNCYISVADEDKPVAAIEFNGQFYSFFKTMPERARAEQIADRLLDKGHRVLMTLIPRGQAIWVYEPEAIPSSRRRSQAVAQGSKHAFEILDDEQAFQACQIKVPDLDKPLTGVTYKQRFYSLLRIVREETQATELAQRLVLKGNDVLITRSAYGRSVWVLEPEAIPLP